MAKVVHLIILSVTSVISCSGIFFPDEITSEICTTHTNEEGQCVNLQNCPSMLELFASPTIFKAEILRRNTCGFTLNDIPRICCPRRTGGVISPVPTSIPITPQSTSIANICGYSPTLLRIFGGQEAQLNAWPWIAVLGYSDPKGFFWGCGGSLISSQWVLTAAHCVHPEITKSRPVVRVRLGEHNIYSDNDGASPVDYFPEQIIMHDEYSKTPQHYNDIALISLDRKVVFTDKILPVCMPLSYKLKQESELVGKPVTVAGWGVTENSSITPALQYVEVPIKSEEECRNKYKKQKIAIKSTQLCAGGGGKDSCTGDSGGPLVQVDFNRGQFDLVGVVSLGGTDCAGELPGIYTKVSEYLDWIQARVPEKIT